MRTNEFRKWLQHGYRGMHGNRLDKLTINLRTANCERVDRYEGDLDQHAANDGMVKLLSRLTYSTEDQRRGMQPRHCVPIDGDVRNGSSTLKSAVNLYRQFCLAWPSGAPQPAFLATPVTTLEEDEYPNSYHRRVVAESTIDKHPAKAVELPSASTIAPVTSSDTVAVAVSPVAKTALKEAHIVFQENQRSVSFDALFGPYLAGAGRITVTDPYLRAFHQQRNLMDLLETISKQGGPENQVGVHVITTADEFNANRQTENFQKMADACLGIGIRFTWEYDMTGTKHDRDITTDHGWKIVLSRGLDVFQRFELNDAFSFANRMQQHRQCKEFNVTFVKIA